MEFDAPKKYRKGLKNCWFGDVEEVSNGEHQGKFMATVPQDYNPDTDSDLKLVGYFDTTELAMESIIKSNNPEWNNNYQVLV